MRARHRLSSHTANGRNSGVQIRGSSALVSGGGSGLGEAVAKELASRGAKVAAVMVQKNERRAAPTNDDAWRGPRGEHLVAAMTNVERNHSVSVVGDYVGIGAKEAGCDFPIDQIGRQRGQALVIALRPAVFDRDAAPLDESSPVEALVKAGNDEALLCVGTRRSSICTIGRCIPGRLIPAGI